MSYRQAYTARCRRLAQRASLLSILLCGMLLSACVARAIPEDTAPIAAQPVESANGDAADGDTANVDAPEKASLLPTVTPNPLPTVTTIATPSATPNAVQAAIARSWGTAPELQSDTWLNSEPLQLADLRGKVVLVEFWTFDCINCRNVLPAMQEWYERYRDDGLVIIGVHTPEFAYEREVALVEDAIARLGVSWPVALDNEKVNWRAYQNHYWPVMYLIDKQGEIRYIHIGEGKYEMTAAVIEELLKGS